MSRPYFFKDKRFAKPSEDDPFESVTLYIPRSLSYILKSKSDELDLPVTRLVCYALDNELSSETPFNYPCTLPESPFVDYAYADEAAKIARFLEKFPSGTGRDMLMLCRRDIGIVSPAVFMLAYRELLETGVIEEFTPKRTKFRYAKNYKYTRLVSLEPAQLKRNRYKKIEGESTKGDLGTRTAREIELEREENDRE